MSEVEKILKTLDTIEVWAKKWGIETTANLDIEGLRALLKENAALKQERNRYREALREIYTLSNHPEYCQCETIRARISEYFLEALEEGKEEK